MMATASCFGELPRPIAVKVQDGRQERHNERHEERR
jgi:hypothetical protein